MAEPGVLHVVNCLNVGGTERQMFELLRTLQRDRWRPHVACFQPDGELSPLLRDLGIEPVVFPLRGSLTQANTAFQIARMALYCRRNDVRLIHAHDFYSNVIGVAAARVAMIPAIASRRDLAHWLTPAQRRTLTLALRLADCVIANAQAVGDRVAAQEGVPASKIRVVPNGIDVAAFDAAAARPPSPPLPDAHGRARIAMVASMHLPDKGHGDLLEAAAMLAAQGLRAQWVLVSDGALRPLLEARAHALGLTDDVCFLGRRDDVPSVIARADLVVHPSWAEGFPNAILEAMCAGKPVVATNVGGIPEVMVEGETGHMVGPKQPAALAERIAALLGDRAHARALGRNGRARVDARFALERMSAAVDAIYTSLAAGVSPPAIAA